MSLFIEPQKFMTKPKQVFQASSPNRWRAFQWSARIIIFFLLLGVVSICIALFHNSTPQLPRLLNSTDEFKALANPDQPLGFKNTPKKKIHHNDTLRKAPIKEQVRAGFYVAWDLQSYFSLRNNISKMNMVIPQWLFVDPNADTIVTQIDPKGFAIIDTAAAKTIPLLSNYFNEKWNDSCVSRIVSTKERRTVFIHRLISLLHQYHFDGVSIDFEDLYSLKNDQDLVEFHSQLYDSLHANKLLATQCIPPFNQDYRINELHKFNDYIFVMAYDQHHESTKPGPISDGKWVEQVLDAFTDKISPDKFVLCLAGYGYDWLKGGTGEPITYQEALTTAKESDGIIDFDNNGYNCTYKYLDEDNRPHEVWFTDAATSFNIMRTASHYGLAGVALWRLGSEDARLWDFYNRNLDDASIAAQPVDVEKFSYVKPSNNIDYIGEGEILDILSTPEQGKINAEYNVKDQLVSEETYVELPSAYVVKKFGKAAPNELLLTFDDGPDPKYTPEIISILKKENVPAAFFLVGENAEANINIVQQLYNDGYEIGNHTFTHPNIAEVSIDRAKLEMNATRRLIEIITGHSTVMFRPPFNADAEPQDMAEITPVEESRKENYITIGESIDPQDWDTKGQNGAPVTADSIFDRIVREQTLGGVILLHDAGGDRSATVEALPKIIHYYRDKGYRFITIAELLNKKKEDLMPAITNRKERLLNGANYGIVAAVFFAEHFILSLFFIAIILAMGRMLFMGVLATIQFRRSKNKVPAVQVVPLPLVSIIVPAYNENVNAVKTVENLLQSDYAAFEIIFVDDGSVDDTYELVRKTFEGNPKVQVLTKANGGKASALNLGIQSCNGELLVCIDADTQLKPDAISKLVESFTDEDVGAVAGNVKVGNEINILTRWQSIEYITAQNFDRKAFDVLNCITVVPGAIGAFRKAAVIDAGGFTGDTLAEDCDLTVRIIRCGWKVTTNNEAIAMTEAPEKLKQFLAQRFRWCFGIMQTFWKHREACFNSKYKALGWVALPNILIFQILLPLFAPLVDLIMIVSLIMYGYDYYISLHHPGLPFDSGDFEKMATYYLIFQVVDLAGAILAFSFEKANVVKLWMLIPQRFIYRWLMYYVLFKALGRAMKGELQHWGVLKRTGNVKIA